MEREISVAVIGELKTSGGPSPPTPTPTPTAPSSPASVGRRGSPPPPPRAIAAKTSSVMGEVKTSGGPSPPSPTPTPPSSPSSVGRRGSPPPPPRAIAAKTSSFMGEVKTSGGPSPPSPTPTTPSSPSSVGRRGSPPPPPRATAAKRGPHRQTSPMPIRVSISWGHKRKKHGGRRRPRPIGCIYPKFQAPKPRGRPCPEPISAMRRRGVEAIVIGSSFDIPKKALTGNSKIDEANRTLCDTYGAMLSFFKCLSLNRDEYQSKLRSNICALRTSAFQLRRSVLASGYKPVNEPLIFKGVCPRKV